MPAGLPGTLPSLTDISLCCRPVQASQEDMDHFVEVVDGQFVANCKVLYLSGWNQWEAVEAGAGALELFGASMPPNTTSPALMRRLLDRAVANGFNLVRAWAHSVTAQYALQVGGSGWGGTVGRHMLGYEQLGQV